LGDKLQQRITLVASVAVLLLLEVLIYLVAASQAGDSTRLIVSDAQGRVVYEAPGNALTRYEKMLFEETHGPLANYQIHVQRESRPFPTRIWLAAAVGIPIGLILLLAFLIRVYLALIYGESSTGDSREEEGSRTGRLSSLQLSLQRFSIFHLGALLVAGAVLFWLVPDFLVNAGKVVLAMMKEFPWLLPALAIFFALLVVWVIYLRYRLSQQMLKNQFDLEKYRLDRELLEHKDSLLLTDHCETAAAEADEGRNRSDVERSDIEG